MSDDFPPIHYPHPTMGNFWDAPKGPKPEARIGHRAPAELLLKIAKEARGIKEIWENFVAEGRYWVEHGVRDEYGYPLNPPMGGYQMVQRYYADYVVSHNIPEEYYLFCSADLRKLIARWASGEAQLDDDEKSLVILNETRNTGEYHA